MRYVRDTLDLIEPRGDRRDGASSLATEPADLSHGMMALAEVRTFSLMLRDRAHEPDEAMFCLMENTNALVNGLTRRMARQLDWNAVKVAVARRS